MSIFGWLMLSVLNMNSGKWRKFCMARKKNKTAQTTNLPITPALLTGTIPLTPPQRKALSHVPPVAVLIDGENVVAPDYIAYILVEAGKMGGVTVRHVYGNWSAPSMQSWKKHLEHYGLEPMGNRSGHNATDIALVIGAMDLFYQGMKHFCLVAGDSDYVPLVQRLRRDGCTVLVIGTTAVSTALKDVSSLFVSTDQLLPQVSSASPISASVPSIPVPTSPSQTSELAALLTDAYTIVTQKSGTEWVLLSILGGTVRKCKDFEVLYGKKSLSKLIKQYPDCFEMRKRQTGKGEVEEMRLRNPLNAENHA